MVVPSVQVKTVGKNELGFGRLTGTITAVIRIVLWLALSAAALIVLTLHSSTPGDAAHPPTEWPTQSRLVLQAPWTLVIFIHPHCPCTKASISDLARLMAKCPTLVADAVFVKPEGCAEQWTQTDIFENTGRIHGVKLFIDEHGQEAKNFATSTSGQVVLYAGNGKLVFSGGITGARGHEGDNAGSESIANLVNNQGGQSSTEVYGCPLFNPAQGRCSP